MEDLNNFLQLCPEHVINLYIYSHVCHMTVRQFGVARGWRAAPLLAPLLVCSPFNGSELGKIIYPRRQLAGCWVIQTYSNHGVSCSGSISTGLLLQRPTPLPPEKKKQPISKSQTSAGSE